MSTIHRDTGHLPEEELVQFLDEELGPAERLSIASHLAVCVECRERLEELEFVSSWVGRNLPALTNEVRVDEMARARALAAARNAARPAAAARTAGSARLLKAAAVVGLIVAAGASVPPVLAWVAEQVGFARGEVETLPPVGPIVVTPADAGATVSFRPVGSTFRVELTERQVAGTVSFEVADVEGASAQILEGRDEAIVVLPSGVRVENSAESTASYRVVVPASLIERIEVVVGGVTVAGRAVPTQPDLAVVDLAAGDRSQ